MWGAEYGSAEFQKDTGATDGTLVCYEKWLSLLSRWNSRINLVASSTLDGFWYRHALDSHQVQNLLPASSKTILDLGAGAGFPGIALAIALRKTPEAHITLVESNGKKCNFLRTVIRELSLPATAVQQRAENIVPAPYDVITARAFAPLSNLLTYAHPFWHEVTVGIFPKGESWEKELVDAQKVWGFEMKATPSQTDENAKILSVTNLRSKREEDHRGQSIDQKTA